MMPLHAELTVFDRIAVAVAVVSAGTLLLELAWPHELEVQVPAEQPPAPIEQTADNGVPVGPLSDYFSVSERPLFTHDRKPFVFAVEAAPAPVGPRIEFELTAVIMTSARQLALLRSNLTPTVQRVAVDQAIDGWTLAAVSPDSVLMRQGEVSITVPLRPDLGGARSGHAVRIDAAAGAN